MDAINGLFRSGRPSAHLASAGVILHQFDGQEEKGRPWVACVEGCMTQGQTVDGRLSSTIVYRALRDRADRQAISLAFPLRGGLVLHPYYVTLDCAYADDAASTHQARTPLPGCPDERWCDRDDPFAYGADHKACGFKENGPAWRAEDLDTMLKLHAESGVRYTPPGWHSGYNEVIISSKSVNDHMPLSILGFFVLRDGETVTSLEKWSVDVVHSHALFLAKYGLAADDVPLLSLDPSNWQAPFSVYRGH